MRSIYLVLLIVSLVSCTPAMTIPPTSTPSLAQMPASTMTATSTSPIPTPLAPPPAIGFASYAYDGTRGEFVQFGGTNPDQCYECNATWVWDGRTWGQRQPQDSPPGRLGAGLVYDEAHQNSVLFGSSSDWTSDTWIWDGQNWIEKHPAQSPSPRSGVSLVYDPDHKVVVLFGGLAPNPRSAHAMMIAFNETWIWDGENWAQAHPKDSPPAPESVPWTMAYDGSHHCIVLYEGVETWTWDGMNWHEQHPVHSPEAAFYGAMGDDEVDHQFVFVGQTLDYVTQTWLWSGMDWIQVKTQLQLDLGSQPHLFFDTRDRALLLYSVNGGKPGVTGFSMWRWKDNDWIKIYQG